MIRDIIINEYPYIYSDNLKESFEYELSSMYGEEIYIENFLKKYNYVILYNSNNKYGVIDKFDNILVPFDYIFPPQAHERGYLFTKYREQGQEDYFEFTTHYYFLDKMFEEKYGRNELNINE